MRMGVKGQLGRKAGRAGHQRARASRWGRGRDKRAAREGGSIAEVVRAEPLSPAVFEGEVSGGAGRAS